MLLFAKGPAKGLPRGKLKHLARRRRRRRGREGGQVRGAKECANGLIGRCRELLFSEQSTRVTSKQEKWSRIYQL